MHMATKPKRWTLEEVHSLPDDGNKYELVHGELFVTPAPTSDHETILARLSRVLEPYVAAHDLGLVYHPRAVVRFGNSEVEPDLMVRQPAPRKKTPWNRMPKPILVVEVLSEYTRRRDMVQKRTLYIDGEIAEYWMVDPESQTIVVTRPDGTDLTVRDVLTWHPAGANDPLTVSLAEIFA